MYKVTVIGGGTGSFTILNGLKYYPDLDIAAIVAMTDSGGSTGVLRDELGALPPGDLRQCLIALSMSDEVRDLREIFNCRVKSEGSLDGHSLGNLIISILEQKYKSLDQAIEVVKRLLEVHGDVIPVTFDNVKLCVKSSEGAIIENEAEIDKREIKIDQNSLFLKPTAYANEKAIERILDCDLIVVCPGSLFTSILAIFLVKNISPKFIQSRAKKVYVCNIMNQTNHTDKFRVINFINLIEQYIGQKNVFDYVLYNDKMPTKFLDSYQKEGEYPVEFSKNDFKESQIEFVGQDLLYQKESDDPNDPRGLIRHDSHAVATAIYSLITNKRE